MALFATFALLTAACGDDSSDTTGAAAETTEAETTEATEGADAEETTTTAATAEAEPMATAVDIDAALNADLTACEPAPTGAPINVGMAMDFSEVSGFADIPGSQAAEHMAALINCVGGVDDRPIGVQVQDIQGDPEVTLRATQDLLDGGAHFLIGPPFADFGQPVLQVTEGKLPVFFAASTEPSLPDIGANSFLVTFDDTARPPQLRSSPSRRDSPARSPSRARVPTSATTPRSSPRSSRPAAAR